MIAHHKDQNAVQTIRNSDHASEEENQFCWLFNRVTGKVFLECLGTYDEYQLEELAGPCPSHQGY